MKNYLWIGLGGMIGASLRYGVSHLFYTDNLIFPWDTLTVNLIGTFILSLITFSTIIEKRVPKHIYPMITTGILGSFTTFSAIMTESVQLITTNILLACIYLSVTFIGGLLLAGLGYYINKPRPEKQVV